MRTERVQFENREGLLLTGHLVTPADRRPHNFVLFAHCFTCNKNLTALRNIGNALAREGFGVLRFDFTGLGESDGDFGETNFSGNVEDLEDAAGFLKTHYQAPSLLVGHSLGGAAVLFASARLPFVKSVAVIGAPADPDHVTGLLHSKVAEIQKEGKARVTIGGREFTIKKHFLEDLQSHSLPAVVHDLDAALLILHSPQDRIVSIANAEEIYREARHPKSFVSLDGASHLLENNADSSYAGRVIASWASRYVHWPEEPLLKSDHEVVASLDGKDGYTTEMKVGNHYMTADEPRDYGGQDFGPSPYELLSASLSACTAMTLQMYARRKQWPLDNVEVHTSYGKEHAQHGAKCHDDPEARIDTFRREIILSGPLQDDQRQRLMEIAGRCPVHRSLSSPTQILSEETT
ncbi:MAG: bifunctional alpha/beta hydrolase/OsmC family protein [Robiginitalea sp.]